MRAEVSSSIEASAGIYTNSELPSGILKFMPSTVQAILAAALDTQFNAEFRKTFVHVKHICMASPNAPLLHQRESGLLCNGQMEGSKPNLHPR